MFKKSILRCKVKCFPVPAAIDSSSQIPMATSKKQKQCKSATNSWSCLSMPETITNKKRSSSPLKSRKKFTSLTNLRIPNENLEVDGRANGHHSKNGASGDTSLLENDSLLHTVTELRIQLEHLQNALEEQERIDADKDRIIERLTGALQLFQSHDRIGYHHQVHKARQRSYSGGSPSRIDPQKFAELRLTPAAAIGDYEGDLV